MSHAAESHLPPPDQATLHAAVTALAQKAQEQPAHLFVRPEGHADPWGPEAFVAAVQDAAAGNTEGLQLGIFRVPYSTIYTTSKSRHKQDVVSKAVLDLWQELFAAAARAGHLQLLTAMGAANPDLFRSEGLYKVAAGLDGCGLEILRWLWFLLAKSKGSHGERRYWPSTSEPAAIAAGCGQLKTLQWLLRWGFGCPEECARLVAPTAAWQQLQASKPGDMHAEFGSAALCTLAAEIQDLGTLHKLLSADPPCPFDAQTGATLARHGHTEALKALHGVLPESTAASLFWSELVEASARSAAQAGQLGTLQWLWGQCTPSEDQPSEDQPRKPRSDGHLQQVSAWPLGPDPERLYCKQHYPELANPGSKRAFKYKPPDRASWALDLGKAAIQGGHAQVLEWMWDKCPDNFWRQEACKIAEKGAKLGLRWLLACTPPCAWEPDIRTGYQIAEAMHDLWEALSHHCQLPSPGLLAHIPMDPFACRVAAATNNMELMVWLRSHGCPWDARACSMAARHGHLGMLKWLRSQQPPCDWVPHTCLLAAQHDQPVTLQWLLEQGCPPPSRPELASDRCLGILVQQQVALSPAATSRAAALGLLSTPLVVGLARWWQKAAGQPQNAGSQPGSSSVIERSSSQLLQGLSKLPEEIVLEICGLAGMCKPIKPA